MAMQTVYDDKKLQNAFEEGYAKGKNEQAKFTAEIEHELSARCNSLSEANEILRDKLECMEVECVKLQAQMDVVRLIFGGRNHG